MLGKKEAMLYKTFFTFITLALLVFLWFFSTAAFSQDWPCYRADIARSARSTETLEFPLEAKWVYKPSQGPQPAWPDPIHEPHEMDFDNAFEPVMADGMVLFGSSADDSVRALDAATGELKWRFITGGPVRFAPAVSEGAVYVASDDGWLYCLDVSTGEEIWKFHGALNDRHVLGHGRMISRRPLRSGVLVDSGVAYITAGMWPAEGVFVFALDARTGEEIWVNGTSASRYQAQPHGGAYSLTGVAPQGYLAATEEVLLVPSGRAAPAGFDRRTGELLHYRQAAFRMAGGSWLAINPDEDAFICGYGGLRWPQPSGDLSWRHGRGNVHGEVRTGHRFGGDTWPRKRVPGIVPPNQALIGDGVRIRGLDGAVAAYDAEGKEIWRRPVEGEARGLAIADGRLVLSTSAGHIHCFAPQEAVQGADAPFLITEDPGGLGDDPQADATADRVLPIVSRHGITRGYALVTGVADGRLAVRLAAASELHVVVVPEESAQVAEIRNALVGRTTLHGSRVSVIEPESLAGDALPPYFANLIVVAAPVNRQVLNELHRLLRPYGGVMMMPGRGTKEQ